MTLNQRKSAIAAAFGAAAADYDGAAVVQHEVAARLASILGEIPLAPRPLVLDVGCGTGFLMRALRRQLADATWVASDLSPEMVARCRAAAFDAEALYVCMDGEYPAVCGGFDLICSSLVFQWFEDQAGAVRRLTGLLRPGGVLAFSTLAADTFREWREAHAALGLVPATPDYPTLAELSALWPDGGSGTVIEDHLVRRYSDAATFVATLKRVGAHAAPHHHPIGPGQLRKVLRRLDTPISGTETSGTGGGVAITYHVAYGIYRKEGE
ncbi:MAG: methyltransferase domain-containing protein [Alphaproteobacteria bacterium]|nr:methyltransferase domain-containing protein [Alphaproteobacteria bacterium]